MNQAPHQLDLFQWLGGMPIKVRGYCKVGVGRDINVENDVTIYTEYDNGATGVFITSTHDAPGSNRLEIDGDAGRLVIEQNSLTTESFIFNKLPRPESEMNRDLSIKAIPMVRTKTIKARTGSLVNAYRLVIVGQHMGIFRNFSRAVLHGEALIAPGVEGINGLTLANAAYLSGWLDKEIVLPLDEALYREELEKRVAEEKLLH
jgi:predicted dehydrogenase